MTTQMSNQMQAIQQMQMQMLHQQMVQNQFNQYQMPINPMYQMQMGGMGQPISPNPPYMHQQFYNQGDPSQHNFAMTASGHPLATPNMQMLHPQKQQSFPITETIMTQSEDVFFIFPIFYSFQSRLDTKMRKNYLRINFPDFLPNQYPFHRKEKVFMTKIRAISFQKWIQ